MFPAPLRACCSLLIQNTEREIPAMRKSTFVLAMFLCESCDQSTISTHVYDTLSDAQFVCPGSLHIVQSDGNTSLVSVPGYPVFESTPGNTLFSVSIVVPCEGIDLSEVRFAVHSSADFPSLQVRIDTHDVGTVTNLKQGLVWNTDGLILPDHDTVRTDISFVCEHCDGFFPSGTEIVVCLGGATWDSVADDGQHSQTYRMGAPESTMCQTTQF